MITRRQLRQWSEQTWQEMLKSARNKDLLNTRQKHLFVGSCKALRIQGDYEAFKNKPVRGTISQGWKDLNKPGPLFQKSLEKVAEVYPEDWTPAEYSLDYFATCLTEGIRPQDIDLGRSLRNLPSFLREYLLLDAIREAGARVGLPSADDNAQTHVDLTLSLENRDVTIWSYMNTDKAIKMLRTKIKLRGIIKSGFNLFAPIQTRSETTNYYDWHVPSADYVERLLAAAADKPAASNVKLVELTDETFRSFLLLELP
jgi:hypothetical protein